MRGEHKIAREVYEAACAGNWDVWREHYDQLSIEDLIFINLGIDGFIKDQYCRATEPVIECLKLINKERAVLDIIELGCHRGSLAEKVLEQMPGIAGWCGYDVNYYALINPVVADKRYTAVKQTEWFFDVRIKDKYNTFVTTSTLEHHNEDQFVKILENVSYASKIDYMVLGFPVNARGWPGYVGSHVLDIDKDRVSEAIESVGFDCFFHKREGTYIWGCKRK